MDWIATILLSLLAYIYAGYPLLIWLLARFRGRPVKKGDVQASVSVLMAAHNEAEALPRKVEQLLELAETEPIREIWIGLDGCTDGTGARVRETRDHRLQTVDPSPVSSLQSVVSGLQSPVSSLKLHILEFEQRRGKAAVLNDLMGKAGQPVFVMMDARQRVEAGAISRLLENFADPKVGVVSGALVYESAAGAAQKGADSYWGYEKFIRDCESRFWAVPGATGALYAIRKELCEPIPENTLVDDVLIPMRAVLKGFRCLFEPSARVFDLPTARFDQEGLRKRRTLAGIWQIWRLEPKIYSFFANPIAFQWFSHKFLRLLTPFLVVLALFSAGMAENWRDEALGGAGLVLILLAGLGVSGFAYAAGRWMQSRFLGLLGAFWGINLALTQAAWDAWTGRFANLWNRTGTIKPD